MTCMINFYPNESQIYFVYSMYQLLQGRDSDNLTLRDGILH